MKSHPEQPDAEPSADARASNADQRATALRRANAIADLLDNRFALPGTDIRFGLDAIVGLIPGIGDAVTSGISAYIVLQAFRLRIGPWPITKMIVNIALDFLVGLIPGLDLIFDVAFKANVRNAAILKKALDKPKRTGA